MDLMKEFFKRDLTDAEDQQLADLLAASPKSSLRFADLAYQAYRKTGLPDEGGSGQGGGLPTDMGPMVPLILKGLLLLAMVGVSIYIGFKALHASLQPAASAPNAVAQPVMPQEKLPIPKKIHARPPAEKVAAQPLRPGLPPVTASKPGMVRPVAYDPSQQFEGLDVMVDQKAGGLVTVRALDGSGREVRLLFAGMLKPGKWDFLWDGKLESGEMAQPGTYRVQVQSGKEVLNKEVNIQGEALANQK